MFVAPDISGEVITGQSSRKEFAVDHIQKFKKVTKWGELFISANW